MRHNGRLTTIGLQPVDAAALEPGKGQWGVGGCPSQSPFPAWLQLHFSNGPLLWAL